MVFRSANLDNVPISIESGLLDTRTKLVTIYRFLTAIPASWHNAACMPPASFERGLALFDQQEFFDAHEVLEDLWREGDAGHAHGATDKRFLQGLIQVAVGFHHLSTGNLIGARSLLARGAAKFHDAPAHHRGIDVAALRASLHTWQQHLADKATPQPPFPRLASTSPK